MKYLILQDVVHAVRLWPIWVRLGLQDMRLRFRRSALGIGWIFLNLVIMLLAIGFIYSKLLGQDLKEFLPFLTVGLVMWGYITASVVEGGNAFIAAEGYIKQIGLPIYIYIFRLFVSVSLTMLISFLAFIVVGLAYEVQFSLGVLWAGGGLVLIGLVSILLITIFAHLNARFRDISHIASVVLQVTFYVTPIIWPPEMLRQRGVSWVIDWNPFYHLLEVVRRPLLYSVPAAIHNYLCVGLFIFLLTAVTGIVTWRFHRRLVYFL